MAKRKTGKKVASKAADMLDGHTRLIDLLAWHLAMTEMNLKSAQECYNKLRKEIGSLAGSALSQREKK